MRKLLKHLNPKTILTLLLVFLLGWQMGHRDVEIKFANYRPSVSVVNKEPPKNINVDFKLFWDVWDLLSRAYLDKLALDPEKLFYGAISGMVAAVGDPYTVFLPPQQQKFSREDLNGSFEGVGIQLGFNKDKRLTVIAPLDGTPAQKAGIKPGDLIIKINGKDTFNITLPEAVSLIRGARGTKVELSILRGEESEPRVVSLIRDDIIVKSVDVSYKQSLPSGDGKNINSGKKVAVIKLSKFGERTNDEWSLVVSELLAANSEAVVLDLRNNPGGFLDGAVFIASEFLDKGVVVLQENSKGERAAFEVNRVGKLINMPTIVLINKGSASASEIVAGALQDRKRAKLVGEKSFGKGTIQEAEDLVGGSGIHITVAKWLTPNGRWVNETAGLDPEVKVEPEKEEGSQDLQMDEALKLLN
ncbi:MAG: S41 family peptidase [Candidatus Daviesbacteria bacterium]|nr:S41 family peptidase [Candidatus Daviesbacteria bacterium]